MGEQMHLSLPARLACGAIDGYRKYVSPAFPPTCIYTPTCSAYALEAIRRYGAGKGSLLAARRILRCHPLHEGGYDPVP